VFAHRGAGVHQVLRFQGVRGMVGEGAVRFHVKADQVHLAVGQGLGDGEPGHPVPGVHHNLEPTLPGHRHQPVQVGHELGG